jgi:transposase
MLTTAGVQRVYLACGPTDLRKSIDSLAALVQESFSLDPFSPCLFVFCNRERNKLKILYWEHNGFCWNNEHNRKQDHQFIILIKMETGLR